MSARVAFKKKKVVHERLVWIVSVFDNPNDIRNYDAKTMSRIEQEFYGKTKAVRSVMIREIVDKKLLSHSNLTLDEHKKQYKSKCKELEELLLTKNEKYGNSALEPLNVFSEAKAVAGIKVRIDDKLKRIKNAGLVDATEDTLQDLAGYLILLMIAKTMQVTIFKNVYDKTNPHHIALETALQRIQTGKSSTLVSSVRNGDKEKKKELPVVCFSGEFSSRADDALFEHSGFLVLDFDHVDVDSTKAALGMDDFIHSCWTSPSGNGIKALVHITNPERHRDHFRALVKYFERTHGLELDESGINESRACFESYDPEIIIKDDYNKFGHFTTEHAEAQTPTNEAYDYTDYMKLNLAARMIRQAKDGEKWITLNRASILCGGYVAAGRMEEEEVLRVLFREVCKREVDNEDHAKQTIIAGVEKGKQMPIRDIIDEEKSAQREMLLSDGDMSFISSDDEDFRWIDDFSQGKIEIGLDTGDPKLDEFFRTRRSLSLSMGTLTWARLPPCYTLLPTHPFVTTGSGSSTPQRTAPHP